MQSEVGETAQIWRSTRNGDTTLEVLKPLPETTNRARRREALRQRVRPGLCSIKRDRYGVKVIIKQVGIGVQGHCR